MNHPSKFQLIRCSRFGGVREQTNGQTHSLTSYCFYRVICICTDKIFQHFFGKGFIEYCFLGGISNLKTQLHAYKRTQEDCKKECLPSRYCIDMWNEILEEDGLETKFIVSMRFTTIFPCCLYIS